MYKNVTRPRHAVTFADYQPTAIFSLISRVLTRTNDAFTSHDSMGFVRAMNQSIMRFLAVFREDGFGGTWEYGEYCGVAYGKARVHSRSIKAFLVCAGSQRSRYAFATIYARSCYENEMIVYESSKSCQRSAYRLVLL